MLRNASTSVAVGLRQAKLPHHRPHAIIRTVTSSTSKHSPAAAAGQPSPSQQFPLPPDADGRATVLQRDLVKMPTANIIRGLLLLTVMGKPKLMNAATKMVKHNIKLLTGNRIMREILDRTFYWQFCAGATASQIETTCHQLKALGYKGVIAMYAREISTDLSHPVQSREAMLAQHQRFVSEWMDGSLRTIACVKEGDFVALKLTGAGTEAVRALEAGEMPDEITGTALSRICDAAAEKGVKLTVDAEHYAQQKTIDAWTLELMRKYNRGRIVVYNTYQMYLKQSANVLSSHLALAEKEGFNLGVKLVRGAYINSDPRSVIHDTQEDTNKAYDEAACNLATYHLHNAGQGPEIGLILATHNRESIKKMRDLRRQQYMKGEKLSDVVYAQLMGMADELSLSLTMKQPDIVEEPIRVYKYFVWGTTEECMLYLLRRAEENKDAAQRTSESQRALWHELKARFLPLAA